LIALLKSRGQLRPWKIQILTAKALLEVAAEDAQNTYPISPLEAAQAIFAGVENKDFYIFTHKGYKRQLEEISNEYLEAFDKQCFNK
jgi:hypothetical protein